MKRYRSHKIVEAGKIRRTLAMGNDATTVVLEDGEMIPLPLDDLERFQRVEPGWYLVRYADGYLSALPPKAFEEGYSPADEEPGPFAGSFGRSFGWALDMLKAGHRVARQGWNGMWIALGEGNASLPAEKFWNRHTRAFAEQNGGEAEVLPYILFKTADGKILMGWLASQTDMLAEDWVLV
jgi:hypothetical protein